MSVGLVLGATACGGSDENGGTPASHSAGGPGAPAENGEGSEGAVTHYSQPGEPMETVGGLTVEDTSDPEKLKDCLDDSDHLSDLSVDESGDIPSVVGTAEAADGGTITIYVNAWLDGSNLAYPSWIDFNDPNRDVNPTVESFQDIFACTGAYPDAQNQEYDAPLPPDQEEAVREQSELYGG